MLSSIIISNQNTSIVSIIIVTALLLIILISLVITKILRDEYEYQHPDSKTILLKNNESITINNLTNINNYIKVKTGSLVVNCEDQEYVIPENNIQYIKPYNYIESEYSKVLKKKREKWRCVFLLIKKIKKN